MRHTLSSILALHDVGVGLWRAWQDSKPGEADCHEEGGFILQDPDGTLSVHRWPKGDTAVIEVPPHSGCRIDGKPIVMSFHTHPNIGAEHSQWPSPRDIFSIRDDRDLKAQWYAGEIVIADEESYLIDPYGYVSVIGKTQDVFIAFRGGD